MASYINIDTGKRVDKKNFRPGHFTITGNQGSSWFRAPRTVSSNPSSMRHRADDFVTNISIDSFITPYQIDDSTAPGINLADTPVLHLDFFTAGYNDIHLISAIEGENPDTKFILIQDEIQSNAAGDPVWIKWKSKMTQTMRFKRDGDLTFRVYDKDGNTIPFDDQNLVKFGDVRVKTAAPLPPYVYTPDTITLNTSTPIVVIDGVTLGVADIGTAVLITTGQALTDNGVYSLTGVSPIVFTRVAPFTTTLSVDRGTFVSVTEGTIHFRQIWALSETATVDTDDVIFQQDTELGFPDKQVNAVFEVIPYERETLTDFTRDLRFGV